MSETGKHQGVIAYAAAYEYAEVEDILENAAERRENLLSFSFWITLRTRIIWAPLSVPQIWREHTV